MELSSKIVNGPKPLTIFPKSSFLNFEVDSEYASEVLNSNAECLHTLQKETYQNDVTDVMCLASYF